MCWTDYTTKTGFYRTFVKHLFFLLKRLTKRNARHEAFGGLTKQVGAVHVGEVAAGADNVDARVELGLCGLVDTSL